MRTKFRETLWFKKGLADAQAAPEEEVLGDAAEAVDTLPVEDRYNDDGSLAPSDSMMFGLHTGTTQAIGMLRPAPAGDAGVPATRLITELKSGRRVVLALIAVALIAIGGVVTTVI